jgi:hypothetical protein
VDRSGGCLDEQGLRALAGALPGQAPPALALHVAGCAACQARLLAADLPERQARAGAPPRVPRSLGALLIRALLVLAAILLALYSIQRLLG